MKIHHPFATSGLFLLVLMCFSGFSAPASAAEAVPTTGTCYSFSRNLNFGGQDGTRTSDIDSLQHFLVAQGYFDEANVGTGHFGPLTLKAVQKFQAAHNVPTTGFVGPLTRAAILTAQPHCSTATSAAKLYSISPISGPVGTQVSIRGFGFSNSNTVLIDGMVAARNIPIASSIAIACTTDPSCHGGINQTLTFTLPSSVSPDCPVGSMCPMFMRQLTPGTTTITVRNDTAVSNGLPFTITK